MDATTNILPELSFVLAAIGWLGHVSAKWTEYRDEVEPDASLGRFLSKKQARLASSLFAAVGAVLSAWGLGWLNPGLGLASGWAANSLADNIAKKAAAKLDSIDL